MTVSTPKHLYIHIPFCHRRCSYCDFNTYANMDDRMEAYVAALCRELTSLHHWWLDAVPSALVGGSTPQHGASEQGLLRAQLRPTIFLGGGTPSMLPLPLMERVLRAADTLVPLDAAEVTVEANPGTVLGRNYLRGLRDLGVNRLSMGVQSLHDPTLRMLGRIHTAQEAYDSFADARAAGFDNINLDFIFGLPGQSAAQWHDTLDTIGSWGAEHFSLYGLILEENTPLWSQVQGGRLSLPDDDATAAMYEAASDRLGAAGYTQYEISNWCRNGDEVKFEAVDAVSPDHSVARSLCLPAYACQHNVAYWLNADYLAAGAGAHGHVRGRRYYDVLAIDAYIAAVASGEPPVAEVLELTPDDIAAETMLMGLRLACGVGYAHFRERTGRELAAVYGPVLDALVASGLLARDASGVRLTQRGRMLGNQVFQQFV
jgi:oxygen-independent coproporphyrinogen III oxidase